MRIGLAQMSMKSDMEANFQKSIDFIHKASKHGVDLICFPEVRLSPFFAQFEKVNNPPLIETGACKSLY